MLKNWIRKVASYFFSPFFILNCRRAGNKGRLRDIKNQHCVFTCPLMPTSFFFFVSSAVEAVHGSSSAWCRGQTELKRSGLEAQFCSWQGLWEVMGVGGGREEEQMGGERWPAAMSSKGASWFRGWGGDEEKEKGAGWDCSWSVSRLRIQRLPFHVDSFLLFIYFSSLSN